MNHEINVWLHWQKRCADFANLMLRQNVKILFNFVLFCTYLEQVLKYSDISYRICYW